MSETVDLIRRSLSRETREEFDRRVETGADYLREELRAGNLDNPDPTIGMELECYVVDPEGRLGRLPEGCLDGTPVNRELGRHNVEINTPPSVLGDEGIASQAGTIHEHLATARRVAAEHDRRVVLDAMWTVPPHEGTLAYLSAVEEEDGVVLAANMHEVARYHAMDNDILDRAGGGVELDLPGVRETFPSILVESLATSIQPHLQVPDVETFPAYYNAAIRTLGPVLALATNSPFLPVDLYDDTDDDHDADPADVLDATYHELRIPVFEQSINAGQEWGKVRFPRDIDGPADVIDRVVRDGTLVPFLHEWVEGEEAVEGWAATAPDEDGEAVVDGRGEGSGVGAGDGNGVGARGGGGVEAENGDGVGAGDGGGVGAGDGGGVEAGDSGNVQAGDGGHVDEEDAAGDGPVGAYTDAFWEFDHKHGTYWRWIRGVIGGDVVDERNDERSLRIEYRPLPTQPSVADVVGLQCLVSGLLRGIVATDHPLATLEWADARESFYGVVEDGLDAELHWVTAHGEHTTEPERIYEEVFDLARRGLEDAGVSGSVRERYLRPIEARWERRRTPSAWKLERVERAVEDGASLAEAIERMQREYVDRAAGTRPFVEWR